MVRLKKISYKVILLVLVVMAVGYAFITYFQIQTATDAHLVQAVNRARGLTTFCEQIRRYLAELRDIGTFADERLLEEFRRDRENGMNYRDTAMYRTIPVVGSWVAAREKAEELGYSFRVPKNVPRNPMNAPRPGLEQSVVDYLEGKGTIEDIEKAGGEIIFPENKQDARKIGEIGVIHTGTETLNSAEGGGSRPIDAVRFFRAIVLSEDCLACHGDPRGGSDFLGFEKEGWKAGEVHGAFEIISPLEGLRSDIAGIVRNIVILAVLVLVAGSIVFYLILKRIVSDPIQRMRDFTRQFGAGNLGVSLSIESDDEVGDMARDLWQRRVQVVHRRFGRKDQNDHDRACRDHHGTHRVLAGPDGSFKRDGFFGG